MGFKHGPYLNCAEADRGGWAPGDKETWRMKAIDEELLLSNLFVTMLQRLGVETETFANSTGCFSEG